MKNIHIFPTDKPSRLFVYDGKLGLAKGFQYGSDAIQNQEIYITNDEEIKDGDWFIFKDDNTYLFQSIGNTDNTHIKAKSINEYGYGDWNKDYCKKIILTTDQDLIKDFVQSINDEFLKWFVKNPSCEEVEIAFNWHMFSNKDAVKNYKIIIPKEEAKQETLEEVAINNYKELYEGEPLTQDVPIDAFINGAKWQQEIILDFIHSEMLERRDYSASKMCEVIAEFIENGLQKKSKTNKI